MEDARDLVPGVNYPRTFQEVDEWFRGDADCREYIRRMRWPGWVHMPALRVDGRAVGDVAAAAALPRMLGADVTDGRDNPSGHPKANVVHGDVVSHQPKERRQRSHGINRGSNLLRGANEIIVLYPDSVRGAKPWAAP